MHRIKVIKFFVDKTVLKVYFIEKEAKASLMHFFALEASFFVERKKTWTIIFHMTENMMRAE